MHEQTYTSRVNSKADGWSTSLSTSQVRVVVFGTLLTVLCKPMFAMLSSVYAVAGEIESRAQLSWSLVRELYHSLGIQT